MANKQPNNRQRSPRPWVKPSDQLNSFVLVASALVMSVSYWFYHGGHHGELIEIDRASPLRAKFLVDINRADWPEIIQLPGLGETLAERVVAEREANGPFHDIDDLVRVDGIGVKTLERIRPYLLPIPQDTDWAEVETGDGWIYE